MAPEIAPFFITPIMDVTCALHFFDTDEDNWQDDYSYLPQTPWRTCHCSEKNYFWHLLDRWIFEVESPMRYFFTHMIYEAIDYRNDDLSDPDEWDKMDDKDYTQIAYGNIRELWQNNNSWMEEWDYVPGNSMSRRRLLKLVDRALDEYDESLEESDEAGESEEVDEEDAEDASASNSQEQEESEAYESDVDEVINRLKFYHLEDADMTDIDDVLNNNPAANKELDWSQLISPRSDVVNPCFSPAFGAAQETDTTDMGQNCGRRNALGNIDMCLDVSMQGLGIADDDFIA
ncbi:hypothetical protein CC79DRAFT_1372133 [Sarocladium strictum]